MGIIERIGAFSGTETAKAINTAQTAFQDRMGQHGHHGRALLETVGEVCRNHPNMVGIVTGLLVEQLLVREKHHYDAEVAAGHIKPASPESPAPLHLNAQPQAEHHLHMPHLPDMPHLPPLRLDQIKPGKLAMEVFGALILFKFSAGLARALRKKSHKHEIWFAPVAKIHLFSGSIATYYIAKCLKAKKVSAWRNAFAVLFLTDAIKPLLKARKVRRGSPGPALAASAVAAPVVFAPEPTQPAPEAAREPTPASAAPASPEWSPGPPVPQPVIASPQVEPYRFPDSDPIVKLATEPPAGHA